MTAPASSTSANARAVPTPTADRHSLDTDSLNSRSNLRFGTTPDRLRAWALATVLAIVAAGLVAWVLADRLVDDTELVARSTGEVLIVNQQVDASFAEAHAAAVSVHLAGSDGDLEQRRLYELAIERAAAGLERVAAVVGDDPDSHAALEQVAGLTTRYVGLVEVARAASVAGDGSANDTLADATDLNRQQISPRVAQVTARFQGELDAQTGGSGFALAFLPFAGVLIVLGFGQYWLFRRFRRIVNVPLVLATAVALAWVGYAGWAYVQQQNALDTGQADAYSAVAVSGQIQDLAFEHRAGENTRVLAGSAEATSDVDIRELTRPTGLFDQAEALADTPREAAMVSELRTRWSRYLVASEAVDEAVRGRRFAEAESVTSGLANDTFNGFNASAEALLLENREQFFTEVDFAVEVVRWLRLAVIIATIAAVVLTWWGYSIRRQEYR